MAHSPPPLHGPDAKRPKGILKNSTSYHRSPPQLAASPESIPIASPLPDPAIERDLVLQNTLKNAGPRRRSSSGLTRRSSQHDGDAPGSSEGADDAPHVLQRRTTAELTADAEAEAEAALAVQWDEANIGATATGRKNPFPDPKTPFVKGYDPASDLDLELAEQEAGVLISPQNIKVDELDTDVPVPRLKRRVTPDMNIPDLDIGEPKERVEDFEHDHHKHATVVVEKEGRHDPEEQREEAAEELEKHRRFEERRKAHYEMKNAASLLSHHIDDDEEDNEDDDGDQEMEDAPEVSKVHGGIVNGEK